jgi:hypothetical protein
MSVAFFACLSRGEPMISCRMAGAIALATSFAMPCWASALALRVDAPHDIDLPDHAVVLWSRDYGSYRWLRVAGLDASAAALRQSKAVVVADAGMLHVGRHRFDPLESGAPSGNARLYGDGGGLALVQFQGPLTNAWLTELHDAGVEPLQYYAHNALLVYARQASLAGLGVLDAVRWWGPFLDSYKQNEDLDLRSGSIENISVLFHPRDPAGAVAARFEADGFKLRGLHPAQPDRRLWEAVLTGHADDLARLAAHPEVIWFGYSSPRGFLEDEMASQIVAGNYSAGGVPATGYQDWLAGLDSGLSGAGVIWSVTDSGIDYSHPDLAGRIVGGVNYPGCPTGNGPGDDPSSGGHGTHVAGIVAGPALTGLADSNGFLWGLGVAPGASLFAQNPICAGGQPWPPSGGWQVLSRNALLGGAVGSNNSWTSGEGTNVGYNVTARTHDIMVRDGNFDSAGHEPFVIVFSAGNSGPSAGTLTAPKEAKNPIVVGSSVNFRAGSIDAISGFSSRGPTRDGRIAPIVAAPGQQIASTRRLGSASQCTTLVPNTDGQYSFCSGTSMAAPQVSGAIALLTEWWRNLHDGANPSPAMGKALLVNGAIDITATPIPDSTQGWGRIHLSGSLGLGVLQVLVDQEALLTESGETWSLTVGVPDPLQPLRITLAWTDPPGPTGTTTPALVNNLDLEVETGGDTFLGNVFSGGVSATGGSADTLNNVENVFVPNPGGSAEITVRATSLGGDALLGDPPQLRQDFALVCSNCALEPDYTLSVQPRTLALCAPDEGMVDIGIGQILDFDDPVTVALTDAPAGLAVQFGEPILTPPSATVLALGDTAAVAPGRYEMAVTAEGSTGQKQRGLTLDIFDAPPQSPDLLLPVDGTTYASTTPTLSWSGVEQGQGYVVQVARDPAFTDIVLEQPVTGTSFTPVATLDTATNYWWRVRADNTCGAGFVSDAFRFQTAPEAGECLPEDDTFVHFSEDVDSGAGAWLVQTPVGSAQWSVSTAQPRSPPNSWFAPNIATVSDQRLTSPPFQLPEDAASPVLVFHHWRNIEPQGGTACYDGGILEVSLDDGAFSQVPGSLLLTQPYQGPVNSGFSNPLAGLQAWCGVFESYHRVVVDATAWRGHEVRLRFRLGTDSTVSRTGWHIDDLSVQSCTTTVPLPEEVFRDGFE